MTTADARIGSITTRGYAPRPHRATTARTARHHRTAAAAAARHRRHRATRAPRTLAAHMLLRSLVPPLCVPVAGDHLGAAARHRPRQPAHVASRPGAAAANGFAAAATAADASGADDIAHVSASGAARGRAAGAAAATRSGARSHVVAAGMGGARGRRDRRDLLLQCRHAGDDVGSAALLRRERESREVRYESQSCILQT